MTDNFKKYRKFLIEQQRNLYKIRKFIKKCCKENDIFSYFLQYYRDHELDDFLIDYDYEDQLFIFQYENNNIEINLKNTDNIIIINNNYVSMSSCSKDIRLAYIFLPVNRYDITYRYCKIYHSSLYVHISYCDKLIRLIEFELNQLKGTTIKYKYRNKIIENKHVNNIKSHKIKLYNKDYESYSFNELLSLFVINKIPQINGVDYYYIEQNNKLYFILPFNKKVLLQY